MTAGHQATQPPPVRETLAGWQQWRTTRGSFVPAPRLDRAAWRALSPRRRMLYDLHRAATHASLPLQQTPMSQAVTRVLRGRIESSALKHKPSTRAGVMITGGGYQGKTENVRQVAASLHDHGTKALLLDDITRLRMHRADDQDVLDLIRAFMSMHVTLMLIGVDIPGSGLLREGRHDPRTGQRTFPPSRHAGIHQLEATQTERRFDLIELDGSATTPRPRSPPGPATWPASSSNCGSGLPPPACSPAAPCPNTSTAAPTASPAC